MPKLIFESPLSCSVEELWAFHADVSALTLLTPPGTKVSIVGSDTRVENGALHELRIKKAGVTLSWRARISDVQPPFGFVDTAEKSPFRAWRHHHQFIAVESGSLLRDTVDYELPFGFLGQILDRLIVRRDVQSMFAHRHLVTRQSLDR